MAETNPNGANGTTSDPREKIMWDFYVEGLAQGRENAYEAAIKAGYEETSAKKITVNRWFTERKSKLRRKEMLEKAERNLDRVLDLEVEEEGKINPQLLRIKTDVSTTVAKTLGKEDYSERSETKLSGEVSIVGINYIVPNGDNINPNAEATPSLSEPQG